VRYTSLMDGGLYKSIVWVHALVGVLVRRDIDREQLFRGSNVESSLLGDTRARIPLSDWRALVHRAIHLTQDPGIALTIALSAQDNVLQIVGQLASAAGSLRQAIRVSERYRPLLGNLNRFDLVEEGDRAYFAVAPLCPDPELPQFDAELSMGLIYRLSRRHANRSSEDAIEVWFTHAAPSYAARYAEVFDCPVYFARSRNAILFDRKYLDEPLIFSNPQLLDVLREGAERLLAQQGSPSLPDRVRAMLRHEVDLRRVDVERVARLLKLDARSFRRHLMQADAPWSQLIDEARCRIACEELRKGDTTIRELSERLGFSEQSAFNRAFKRWTGTTPAKYSQDGAAAPLPTSFPLLGRSRRRSAAPPGRDEDEGGLAERRSARSAGS
jgi:AraC-like DNA-binding protein